jgi:dUTP pyrophosphatase
MSFASENGAINYTSGEFEKKLSEQVGVNGDFYISADSEYGGFNGRMDMTHHHHVKVFKAYDEAILPTYGSERSSCFDLYACLDPIEFVTYRDLDNNKDKMDVTQDGSIYIEPMERVMVPTGLIFDLKSDQDLRVHPRSSLAVKDGITLCNAIGVIDPDYVDMTFVPLINLSNKPYKVSHGDRIAQGEIRLRSRTIFETVTEKPEQKTDRTGGCGSTGK